MEANDLTEILLRDFFSFCMHVSLQINKMCESLCASLRGPDIRKDASKSECKFAERGLCSKVTAAIMTFWVWNSPVLIQNLWEALKRCTRGKWSPWQFPWESKASGGWSIRANWALIHQPHPACPHLLPFLLMALAVSFLHFVILLEFSREEGGEKVRISWLCLSLSYQSPKAPATTPLDLVEKANLGTFAEKW